MTKAYLLLAIMDFYENVGLFDYTPDWLKRDHAHAHHFHINNNKISFNILEKQWYKYLKNIKPEGNPVHNDISTNNRHNTSQRRYSYLQKITIIFSLNIILY